MKDNNKDVLLAHYTSNERYHDSKDSLVWLSASVFLGLLLAVWGWLFANPCFLAGHRLLITVVLAVVFVPACAFTWRQNWLKCKSVERSRRFYQLGKGTDIWKLTCMEIWSISMDAGADRVFLPARVTPKPQVRIPFWRGAFACEALPGLFLLWPLILLSLGQFVLVWMPFIRCFLALLR